VGGGVAESVRAKLLDASGLGASAKCPTEAVVAEALALVA
jgi:hypothetical protein